MPPLLPQIESPRDLKRLSFDELEQLAAEIRQAIIGQVSQTGGHLAPNLGVVELTLALHYVFDFDHDRLLFDVGHQCYPHKLITGRQGLLGRLRTREGMAGFPAPRESSYDLFSVGHAGTAISTAVGMARGDQLNAEHFDPRERTDGRRIVSLIGDASIVNGVAMEGLNNAGTLKRQFLVVLNDNGMSISHPQGAVSQYFDRLRMSHIYGDFKKGARRVLQHVPGGGILQDAYHKLGEATKAVVAEGSWFEHFGLVTVGPIDGHHIPTLVEFLLEAREFDRPMVLHAKTIKGKGLDAAECDAERFHSPKPFRIEEDEKLGCRVEIATGGRSFTAAFADSLTNVMQRDERVVACTAAMPDGTGIARAIERFPDRAWDVGICESHAMDMMAGLARTGFKPFLGVYCTFLQRAFDQAFQEVALQGLGVRLCLDRAGLVGGDGAVHHGFCDVALLRPLPGSVVMAAIDEPSLAAAMELMLELDENVSAVRYPRADVNDRLARRPCPPFELGRARRLDGDTPLGSLDAAVLAFGAPAFAALDAAAALAGEAGVGVWDARFAKPVDDRLIAELVAAGVPILTVEEHSVIGGFGDAVLESASRQGLDAPRIAKLGLPDRWVHQDSRSRQLAEVGLDAPGIERALRELSRRSTPATPAPTEAPVQ